MPTRKDLFIVAFRGDTDRLRQLTREGADFNEVDKHGEPFLQDFLQRIYRHRRKNIPYDVVSVLLELGSDPNFIPEHACSALFYAVLDMDTRMLEILLDAGADPNMREAGDYPESLYDWAQFDYRYEIYDCPNYPQEPTDDDRKNADSWLAFLDRIAIENNVRRPDHLILLRSRGALTARELGWFNADETP